MPITPERFSEWLWLDGKPFSPRWWTKDITGRPRWYRCEWERLSLWRRLLYEYTWWDPRGRNPYADEREAVRRSDYWTDETAAAYREWAEANGMPEVTYGVPWRQRR